ncbi:MAG: DNA polymerase/3'-5' exonuclease PolX [Burkholderiaceae bacterium]
MSANAAPRAAGALNVEIAAAFSRSADLLEADDANRFRVRAYRNAARTVAGLSEEAAALLARGERLDGLPGIGRDLAGKIAEFVRTGHCEQLDALRARIPAPSVELLKLPGLGPRRVAALRAKLGVSSPEDLAQALHAGRLRSVAGFGPKLEQQLADALGQRKKSVRRTPLASVAPIARELAAELLALHGVEQAMVAGSVRRRRDDVGDIDLVVAARAPAGVVAEFARGARVAQVRSQGTTRGSVVLRDGLQADLRCVAPASFGSALLYLTGSKSHDVALRRLAHAKGLKLNEYGLYRGARRIAGATEESVYAALGLAWIPPELREDRGEIEAAAAGRLPVLVQCADLRGDLHAHSTDSDGRDSIEAMAAAARARGLRYLAITDHSRGLAVAHGLDADRLARQIDRIDALNAGFDDFTLLKGAEVDIHEDGSLDLPDAVLARLDLVVGAVHAGFGLSRERQTARLLRAMDHASFSILAHPGARLLGRRAPIAFDLEAVLRHARERGCFVELNAQPERLDLDDTACRAAREAGVLVSIASDAHGVHELDDLDFGIAQARRGWLEAVDVLNTRELDALRALLAPTLARAAPALRAAA